MFETGTSGVVFVKMLDEMKAHIDVNRVGTELIKHVAEHKES